MLIVKRRMQFDLISKFYGGMGGGSADPAHPAFPSPCPDLKSATIGHLQKSQMLQQYSVHQAHRATL